MCNQGVYFSEELDVSYTVTATAGGLRVLLPNARHATEVVAHTKVDDPRSPMRLATV